MTGRPKPNGKFSDGLYFLPLGGSGEIGMNLNLYALDGKWLMVDLGVTFGGEDMPGVEVILPDPAFIEAHRDDLIGLVLTHAHEDHLGAVPYLWQRLRCPIYATGFTASLLRRKLYETGWERDVPITEIPLKGRFQVGPFDIEMITLTHSIPEPNALAIRTRLGTILHTGDWKFDPGPVIGEVSDEAALQALGAGGVLALIGDSTNAMREGVSGSEADLRPSLDALIAPRVGRIAVACFASNVARLDTIARIAAAHDRHVALVGRSLWRIHDAAKENGYLVDLPRFLDEREAAWLPRDKVLLICTGSQGEPRAALARIAAGEHPHVVLERGDTAIFSSRIIPGNERPIARLHNALSRRGVELVTEIDHFVHVSGHPARDDLTRMYQLVRPRIAVPVHGEAQHMAAHARLAEDCQVQQVIIPENGTVIRLAPGKAAIIDRVHSGRLAADGGRLLAVNGPVLAGRRRVAWNGAALVTIVLDSRGRLVGKLQIAAPGLLDPAGDSELHAALAGAISDAVKKAGLKGGDDSLREAVRRAVRNKAREWSGKKPVTEIHLVRV